MRFPRLLLRRSKGVPVVLAVLTVALLPPGCGGKTNQGPNDGAGDDAGLVVTPPGSQVDASASSSGSSSGGGFFDAASPTEPDSSLEEGPDGSGQGSPAAWDAAIADGTIQDAAFDVAPAPTGEAGFAFVVNGVVQTPLKCTGHDWEFPFVPGEEPPSPGYYPPIPGIQSVVIVNTGTLPMPYLAQSYWELGQNVPGGATGQTYQLAGVLEAGQQVDITSVYLPGYVALLGSAQPFSSEDAGYAADDGTITWPLGVPGSGGAGTMYVAQIYVPYDPPSQCTSSVSPMW